jgi:acetyltransferase-like isoleucine patch superfamily enzyme
MNKTKKLIIFGAGTFAEMAAYLFDTESDYEVEAFCVDPEFLKVPKLLGKPVMNFNELTQHFSAADYEVFVAVGIGALNTHRANKCTQLKALGYRLASFTGKSVKLPLNFQLRENTMIMDGCQILPYVEIGSNCILWTNTRIGLKSKIEDNCWLVGAALGENVLVGQNTFIGMEATIAPFVVVGEFSLIGIQALVMRNCPPRSVFGMRAVKPSRVKADKAARLIR